MPNAQADNLREIPIDTAAEQALVGSMLLRDASNAPTWSMGEITAIVERKMFVDTDCATIFEIVMEADVTDTPIDLVTVVPMLTARAGETREYWSDATISLSESVPSAANAGYYARAVRRAWQRRQCIQSAEAFVREIYADRGDVSDHVGALMGHLSRIERLTQIDKDPRRAQDLLANFDHPSADPTGRIPIGFGELGRLLGGSIDCGSLVVIGARPSKGKTSLGLSMAHSVARASDGCSCYFASLEMKFKQLSERILSIHSTIPVDQLRSGNLPVDQFTRERNKAMIQLRQDRPIFITEGVCDARAIASHARRLADREGVRMVCVDYLGFVDLPGKFDRHDLKIGAITALFKRLAIDAGIVVVLLVQLSRAGEKEGRKPIMADLRDSGSIEQDADLILMLHRGDDKPGPTSDTLVRVVKNRQGSTGDVTLSYHQPTMQYMARAYSNTPSADASAWANR
jgi:replicative DNA helicase